MQKKLPRTTCFFLLVQINIVAVPVSSNFLSFWMSWVSVYSLDRIMILNKKQMNRIKGILIKSKY